MKTQSKRARSLSAKAERERVSLPATLVTKTSPKGDRKQLCKSLVSQESLASVGFPH